MASKDDEGVVRLGGDCDIALKIEGAVVVITIKMDTTQESKQLYTMVRETITDNGCLHIHFGMMELVGRSH